MTATFTLDDVFERIFTLLAEVIDYDSVSLQLLDERGTFSLAAGRGFSDLNRISEIVEGLFPESTKVDFPHERYKVIADTRQDERWILHEDTPYIRKVALDTAALVDFDALVQRTTELIVGRLQYDCFGFANIDDYHARWLPHPSFYGIADDILDQGIPLTQCVVKKLLEDGGPAHYEAVDQTDGLACLAPDVCSVVAVPVMARQQSASFLCTICRRKRSLERGHNEAPGAGLGLAVNRQVIRRHGGTISVWSELGQGASFEILLRAVKQG